MSAKLRHTIGKLATHVGIPTSTVRYYERAGLLRPAARTSGNYRIYEEDAIDRVRFIRAAQATGFTLADIKELLELSDGAEAPCGEVRRLIEKRLEAVERRLREFRHVQRVLQSFHRACGETADDEPCHVIGKLSLSDPAPPDEH